MRKILVIILLFVGLFASAQETPPAGLIPVNGQFFIKITGGDTAIWHFKGSSYGYERLGRYSDLNAINNSINQKIPISSTSTYPLSISGNALTATNWNGQSYLGSIFGGTPQYLMAFDGTSNWRPILASSYLTTATAASTYQSKLTAGNNIDLSTNVASVNAARTLYSKSFFSNLTDFTVTGNTPTIVSNAIRTAAGDTSYNTYITVNNTINADENMYYDISYKVNALGRGISIGKHSITNSISTPINVNTLTNIVGIGFPYGLITPAVIYQLPYTIAIGDIMRVRFIQQATNTIAIIEDITQNKYNSYLFYVKMVPTPAFYEANTSNCGVWNLGASGETDIISVNVYSTSNLHPDVICLGDSKTGGVASVSWQQRWASQLNTLGNVLVMGGPGDATAQVIQQLPYVVSLHPTYVILNIGRNDLYNGVAPATWQANYQNIVNTLTSAGIIVIHLYGIDETSVDQTSLYNFINSTYPTNKINVLPSWSNGTMLSTDNIHPNPFGYKYIANQVISSGLVPLKNNYTLNLNDYLPKPSDLNLSTLSVAGQTTLSKLNVTGEFTSGRITAKDVITSFVATNASLTTLGIGVNGVLYGVMQAQTPTAYIPLVLQPSGSSVIVGNGGADDGTGAVLQAQGGVSGVWMGNKIPLLRGGTNADLSSTGGTGQYVKQSTVGGAFTVGVIPSSDITTSLGYTPVTPTALTTALTFPFKTIPFGTGSGLTSNTNFAWDNINNRLGVGINSPLYPLHVYKSNSGGVASIAIDNPNSVDNSSQAVEWVYSGFGVLGGIYHQYNAGIWGLHLKVFNSLSSTAVDRLQIDGNTGNVTIGSNLTALTLNPTTTQTTISGSTSGNIVASMTSQGSSGKKVRLTLNSLLGSVTYTYPVSFVGVPSVFMPYTFGGTISAISAGSSSITLTTTSATTCTIIVDGY